jgi:SAM-dependent methyltransferase
MKQCLSCHHVFKAGGWTCPLCGFAPAAKENLIAFAPDLSNNYEGYEEAAFAELARLEDGNFWFRSRNLLLGWALKRFFPRAGSFFEIGCGTGFVLQGLQKQFPHMQWFGSDIFESGLAFARKRVNNATLFQMDARQIPFSLEFDVVGAFDVLEHIQEDEEVLQQMFQAVRQGGGLLITVPQHPFLWSHLDEFARHQRRYSRRELVSKASRAGFSIIHVTSFVSLLLPMMILSRTMRRRGKIDSDPFAEFRISPRTNWLLEKTMALERLVLQTGMSMPAGGSLLLIAKKLPEAGELAKPQAA